MEEFQHRVTIQVGVLRSIPKRYALLCPTHTVSWLVAFRLPTPHGVKYKVFGLLGRVSDLGVTDRTLYIKVQVDR